jgi:hypothetical protein
VTPFEYILALVSILIGLAVADLSGSLHRLLRARRRVQWDWLPLAAALLVMMLILEFWWIFYGLGTSVAWTRYSAFLILAASLVCMFLLASATLPDEVPQEGIDLTRYYSDNGRYFWGLFGLFVLLMIAVEIVAESHHIQSAALLRRTLLNLSFVGLLLSLAWVRSRLYHVVLVPVLLVVVTIQWSHLRLG